MTEPLPGARAKTVFGVPAWHALLFVAVVVADQLTKLWARRAYGFPDGEPDYSLFTPVLGDWLHFRLVYNYGAAFGSTPQKIAPFLHPTLFFLLASAVAMGFFVYYYRKLGAQERPARLGILLILSGALGNLIDRVSQHRVTDFIDVGIPDVVPRFPVFNIADSAVTVGIVLLIGSSLLPRRAAPAADDSLQDPGAQAPERSGAQPKASDDA